MKLTKNPSIAFTAILLTVLVYGCSKDVNLEATDPSVNSNSKNTASTLAFTVATADGYAQGTTGGAGGTAITVTTAAAFISAAQSSTKQVITVNGNIDLGNTAVLVKSNKTIIGASTSSGIKGNVQVSNANNVIIQNLNISNPSGAGSGDAIEISGSTNVFVTKCTIFDGADGNLDVVRASDNVTISWCKFYYSAVTTHQFSNLIGNGDAATEDRGKLHVTMHHNWYHNGVNQRMPRVRFGHVHLYNNYYGSNNDSYCVGVGNESHILIENNCFENQGTLWSDARNSTSVAYQLTWRGNVLINSSYPTWAVNTSSPFSRPYSHTMHSGSAIKSAVMQGAGNTGTSSNSTIVSGATYQILAKHSGKGLDVTNVSTANGAAIQQWNYSGGANQKFIINDVGSGYYNIVNVNSGRCLDVTGGSTSNGAIIQQWGYSGGANQQWSIVSTGDGYYKIINRNSGKGIDVKDASTSNGAVIQQYNFVNAANQLWQLVQL